MPPPQINARRVVIVDDNEDAAELLAELLRTRGHDTRVAFDGPSALRVLESFRPNVVLLDIGLPGMSGYEVARQIRKRHAATGLLLIALTGYGQPSDRERTAEAGFDAHLLKPVGLEQLAVFVEGPGDLVD